MKPLFVDTPYWIACINPQDHSHQQVMDLQPTIRQTRLLTTKVILIELLTFFSAYNSQTRQIAINVVWAILTDPNIEVVPHTHEIFLSALGLYEEKASEGYSFVDCISMMVMRDRGLTDVLTCDRHFAQEGFNILL